MGKKEKTRFLIVWLIITLVFLVGSFVVPSPEKSETVKVMMRDAVLHEENRCSFFGLMSVSPAMISAMVVSGCLLLAALLIRIFAIPRFKMVPGKFQSAIELLVSTFDNLAKTNSPRRNSFLGVYAFGAGVYIFVGTIFELFGFQALTTAGHSISLPAPLSDVNAAISLGVLSYFVIFAGGTGSPFFTTDTTSALRALEINPRAGERLFVLGGPLRRAEGEKFLLLGRAFFLRADDEGFALPAEP